MNWPWIFTDEARMGAGAAVANGLVYSYKQYDVKIIAPNGSDSIREHDRILRRLLAQRAQEWRSQRGFHRFFTRIKIEIWAWRETNREMERLGGSRKRSPYSI